jgi:UDP:flavonoid glycosyltransferase YjiC (YdhE family)
MVERAGLGFHPIRPNRAPHQKDPDFLQRLGSTPRSPAALFRDMFMPDLRASTDDLIEVTRGSDCVVVHTLLAGGRLAAEFHGIPWVSAVMQPMGYLSSHEPPVIGPEWISGLLRRMGTTATRNAYSVAKAISGSWMRDWYQLRRELRLPETLEHPLWEGQHSPRRSLGLFPEVLGTPQPDWPVAARVTGFPAYRDSNRRLTEALEAFLRAGDAPIVFTLGTTAVNDPGSFFEVGARAARNLGLRSVLVVGSGVDWRWQQFDENVLVVDYAPHDLLFPRSQLIVHQAGIGTLSEALLAGKPMLIMPYGHDQADNAWRARRLGVASVLPRRRFSAREVETSLQRLMEDPATQASAARVQKVISRDNGARRAAEFIEASLPEVPVRTHLV